MEVHFLSLGSKRRPWEVCRSDREQVAVPVMAPDFAIKVQGKNCTNLEGSTMSILYRWKSLEVYFHMQQTAHPLKLFAESYLILVKTVPEPHSSDRSDLTSNFTVNSVSFY